MARLIITWCHPDIERRFGDLSIQRVPRQMVLRTILTPAIFRPVDYLHEVSEQARGEGCKFAGFWPLAWIAHHAVAVDSEDLLHFKELPLVAPGTEIDFKGEIAFPCLVSNGERGKFHIRLVRKSMLSEASPRFLVCEDAQRFIGDEVSVPHAA
jgi:hypothetical protein